MRLGGELTSLGGELTSLGGELTSLGGEFTSLGGEFAGPDLAAAMRGGSFTRRPLPMMEASLSGKHFGVLASASGFSEGSAQASRSTSSDTGQARPPSSGARLVRVTPLMTMLCPGSNTPSSHSTSSRTCEENQRLAKA
eukprot:1646689-Pyramimonas_sp.AAC.1